MPDDTIAVEHITSDEADRLLAEEEGHFIDLKGLAVKPRKLTKSISAFANAAGGDLYVGVDEEDLRGTKRRVWSGFADQEAANGHIQAFHILYPLSQYFALTFLACGDCGGYVLRAQIHRTKDIVTALDGFP